LESEHRDLVGAKEELSLELCRLRERQTAREAGLRSERRKLADLLRENAQLLETGLQQEGESIND